MTDKNDHEKHSYLVRIEGFVPRADQIAVEAETPEEAQEAAIEIATDEGFRNAKAVSTVPVGHTVVPRESFTQKKNDENHSQSVSKSDPSKKNPGGTG